LNDMPPNERAEVLPQIWSTLDTWPDHLRLWDNRWENLLDCKGLFKVYAQDWDFDEADVISAGMDRNGSDEDWIAAWLYAISPLTWQTIRICISLSGDRVWLLKSGRFSESSEVDFEALFEIDTFTHVATCLMVWPRPHSTNEVVPAFLMECEAGMVAVGFWYRQDFVQGAFRVQIFQGFDTVFSAYEQGRATEHKEMLRHQVELFGTLDAVAHTLWVFAYPGTLYRIDLRTHLLENKGGFAPHISDLVAGHGGVYLIYSSTWIQFINKQLESTEPALDQQGSLLFFSKIVGFEEGNGHEDIQVLGTFWERTKNDDTHNTRLATGPSIRYILRRYQDPLFTFHRLVNKASCQIVFVSPPDFNRILAFSLPSKQEGELDLNQFLRAKEPVAICISPSGESIFFATGVGGYEWRWMD
jgi:hypothetical protein